MADLPTKALQDITTDEHFRKQSRKDGERYVPYSFAQALRKTMAHVNSDDVQELDVNRTYNTGREKIDTITESSVSGIFDGEFLSRKQFEIDFDKGEDGSFPWSDIRSKLGEGPIVHDLPIRRIVIQFDDEEFISKWKEGLDSAIDSDISTGWVEKPFFAVLKSSEAGSADARDNVRSAHEDFYHQPKFESDEDYEGMDWSIRTLDLENVWSYRAFVNSADPILTSRRGDREYEWTPRRIEHYVMNFFDSSEEYTGLLRNSEFSSAWRGAYSLDVTSHKRYEWREEEEWEQTG